MTDIVERLQATLLDNDNFPRMKSEKWLPVGLAQEAADEIRALRSELYRARVMLGQMVDAQREKASGKS